MMIHVLNAFIVLCFISVALLGGMVLLGYCIHRKERRESVGWGMAILARLGEITEIITPVIDRLDATKLTDTEEKVLRKIVEADDVPEKVNEYLLLVRTAWMAGAASRIKNEVDKQVKDLEWIVEDLLRDDTERTMMVDLSTDKNCTNLFEISK